MPFAHTPADIQACFEEGLSAGADPALDADAPGPEGLSAETTLRSPWLHDRCPHCGHSFRPGDRVLRFVGGRVLHDTPGLACARATAPDAADSGLAEAFYAGLAESWPAADGREVSRLLPGDPLLAPPRPGLPRLGCHVCGHTFRAQDAVIRCPCGLDPARCRVAIHRDPAQQLRCWDSWVTAAALDFCPATGRRVG